MNIEARNLVLSSDRRPGISPSFASFPPPAALQHGKVVTLTFLSRRIPEARITDHLAGALSVETGESVLLVRLGGTSAAQVSLADWKRLESTLNGEFCFGDRLTPGPGGFVSLDIDLAGGDTDGSVLTSMIAHFQRHFRHVLLHTGFDMAAGALTECLARSDMACLFINRSADSLYELNRLARSVRERDAGRRVPLRPVMYLAAEEMAHGFRQYFTGDSDAATETGIGHLSLDEPQLLRDRDDVFDAQIRALARSICGRRIGLVLSSGGARGLAHIGVIQMLEEQGIEIDAVAGCSMGAYIAAVWAYGQDGIAMERLAREIETRWGLWKLIDPALPPRRGFINGKAVIRRLKHTIGDAHFSDLARPLRIVATNLATLERVVFSSGEVAAAVHASSAIPGICVPVTIDGETYIDGGVTDPLPVDVLREMGIERIIAVNTIPTPAYLQCCRELEREQAELRARRPALLGQFGSHLNYFARGNILDIMMRAVHGAQIRVAERAGRRADVVLRPLACDARWHDFTHPRKYIALGRQAAEEQLETIKALVKGTTHENDTTQNRMAVAV